MEDKLGVDMEKSIGKFAREVIEKLNQEDEKQATNTVVQIKDFVIEQLQNRIENQAATIREGRDERQNMVADRDRRITEQKDQIEELLISKAGLEGGLKGTIALQKQRIERLQVIETALRGSLAILEKEKRESWVSRAELEADLMGTIDQQEKRIREILVSENKAQGRVVALKKSIEQWEKSRKGEEKRPVRWVHTDGWGYQVYPDSATDLWSCLTFMEPGGKLLRPSESKVGLNYETEEGAAENLRKWCQDPCRSGEWEQYKYAVGELKHSERGKYSIVGSKEGWIAVEEEKSLPKVGASFPEEEKWCRWQIKDAESTGEMWVCDVPGSGLKQCPYSCLLEAKNDKYTCLIVQPKEEKLPIVLAEKWKHPEREEFRYVYRTDKKAVEVLSRICSEEGWIPVEEGG